MRAKNIKLLKKITIIVLSVLLGLSALCGGFIGVMRLPVGAYYGASKKEFEIPGIKDGFVPQGIHYDDTAQNYLFSGYTSNNTASPVYVTTKTGEIVKRVTLLKKDGSDYIGHSGGLAVKGNYLYVAGGEDCCLYVYSYVAVKNAENGAKIECLGTFPTKIAENDYIKPAFVTVADGKIIVGEFYRAKSNDTPASHKITTKAGDYNQALALEYYSTTSNSLGIETNPVKAYSLPNQVQGLTVKNDKVYLSISWGLSFSHVPVYDKSALVKEKDISVLGEDIPLYSLDSTSFMHEYKLPPMSEELIFVGSKMLVLNESASNKHFFGKITGANWLYSTDLDKLK